MDRGHKCPLAFLVATDTRRSQSRGPSGNAHQARPAVLEFLRIVLTLQRAGLRIFADWPVVPVHMPSQTSFDQQISILGREMCVVFRTNNDVAFRDQNWK